MRIALTLSAAIVLVHCADTTADNRGTSISQNEEDASTKAPSADGGKLSDAEASDAHDSMVDGAEVSDPAPDVNHDPSGVLDLTFGGGSGSIVVPDTRGTDTGATEMALDSQGRIVIVGGLASASARYAAAWRFKTDGTLDTGFGENGIWAITNTVGQYDSAYALCIGASDDVAVAGISGDGSGNQSMVVWKLDSSGRIDSSFGNLGHFAMRNVGGSGNEDFALAATCIGSKIVVAGTSKTDTTHIATKMVVVGLTSNGVLDRGFANGNGFFASDRVGGAGPTADENFGSLIAVDRAGNLLVGGSSRDTRNLARPVLWRLTASGALDTSFKQTGYSLLPVTRPGGINGMAIDANGNVVIGGDTWLARVQTNGDLDPSFGGAGVSPIPAAPGDAQPWGSAVAVDSRGRIVVTGMSGPAGGFGLSRLAVWRFLPSGAIDTTFGRAGVFTIGNPSPPFGSRSTSTTLIIDSHDGPIVAGMSQNANGTWMTVWRLTP